MVKIIVSFLLLFSFIFPLPITNDFLKGIQQEVINGIRYLHDGEYDKSLRSFQEIKEKMPGHPLGYFLYSAGLHRLMVDYRNFSFEAEFLVTVNQAIDLAKKMTKENKEDPWSHFYLGASYGFRGIFHSEYGGFWRAFSDGIRGYQRMKKALALDETIYDAYYGVGMFHYWRAVYAGRFYWLFGDKNERYQGIEETKLASEKGFYSKVTCIKNFNRRCSAK